ncbi:MAG: WYL domain-containing protein [Parasporobacterium sp.]|nr:WYL domain-containing protein [Parasporobacterium sp.]
MAKGNNQKLKLLYLAKIFSEETDEEHGLSVSQLVAKLAALDISAERKTLYADMEELRDFGMDILAQQNGKSVTYHLVSRDFELAELKLLVDSVQSSKFISEKKSNILIRKLENLTSKYEAGQLHRQVLIAGRIKSMNESTYYNVDDIYNAINQDRKIRFRYFNWNVDKTERLRKDGEWYYVSPWHLRWDDEYYYLIGYDSHTDSVRHYRVDKMKSISITDIPRDGKDKLKAFNPASYTRKLFGMYSGDELHVVLEGENSLVGVIIDRFGKEIPIRRKDETHFEAVVEVALSPQFLGWIASLNPGIRITGPEPAARAMQDFVRKLKDAYL